MIASARNGPPLYNLTNELIWPDVMNRARSHPEEVYWKDNNGWTALHHSCRHAVTGEVVQQMLQEDSGEISTKMQDESGKTPLHIACWSGSCDVISILLQANQEIVSVKDNVGRTPLHHACFAVQLVSAETMLELIKANPLVSKITDAQGHTPLSLLVQRHESRIKVALEKSNDEDSLELIYNSILQPFWNQLTILLEANIGYKFACAHGKLLHALMNVADCPRILFDLALKLHPEQVQERVKGSLPLHYAAATRSEIADMTHGDGYYVCTLLSLFPQASGIPDDYGNLPLHLAISSGKTYHAVLRKLFQAFPQAIRFRDGRHYLLPFLLSASASAYANPTEQVNSMLELLRLDPTGIKLALTHSH